MMIDARARPGHAAPAGPDHGAVTLAGMTRSAISPDVLQRLTGLATWAARTRTNDPDLVKRAVRHATNAYTMRRNKPGAAEAWVKLQAVEYVRRHQTSGPSLDDLGGAVGDAVGDAVEELKELVGETVTRARRTGAEVLDKAGRKLRG